MKKLNLITLMLSSLFAITACSHHNGNSATSPRISSPIGQAQKPTPPKADQNNDKSEKVDTPKVEAKPAKPKVDMPKAEAKPAEPKVDMPKAEAKPAEPKVDMPKAETKPAEPKVEIPKELYGKVFLPDHSNHLHRARDVQPDNINQLNVEGKVVDVSPPKADLQFDKKGDFIRLIATQENLRYGLIKDKTNDTYAFYQGYITPLKAIPTTGTVDYSGYVTEMDHNKLTASGPSNFTVNFDTKDFSAQFVNNLNPSTKGDNYLNIQGQIEGSRLIFKDEPTTLEGHFFGDKAQEIGGYYVHFVNTKQNGEEITESRVGVFGAEAKPKE